jgi:hypothetical protein
MVFDQATIKEFLSYDPDSGIFTWNRRDLHHFKSLNSQSRWNNRYSGKIAGSIYSGETGYQCIQIALLGRVLKAHRLAWTYMTGNEPPEQIDHKDQDGTNNKWLNLADADGLNSRNQSKRKDNKSGYSGVSWAKGTEKWCARSHDLHGNYKHIGFFVNLEDAAYAVERFRAANGYTKEHGKKPCHYHSQPK